MLDGDLGDGYIKLWRKSLRSPILQNRTLWTFWTWCLLKATHTPHSFFVGYQEIHLESGQFVYGRMSASVELNFSERECRTCMKKLEKFGNLTIKTTNRYSIVSICNWDTYQFTDTDERPADCPANDQQVTSKRPASDQQVTTNKNDKKDKNDKKLKDLKDFLSEHPDSDEESLPKPEQDPPDDEDSQSGHSKKKIAFSDEDMRLALLLHDLMTENNPDMKPKSQHEIESWANTSRLMREQDKRTYQQIEYLVKFSQQHYFWKANILSFGKLRMQYDQLVLKAKEEKAIADQKKKNTPGSDLPILR